jgi:IS5 family transposase
VREKAAEQLAIAPVPIDHPHARELAAMSALLDQLPEAVALVHDDLRCRAGKRIDPGKGRRGMTAEQVLRCAIAKQLNGWSYHELTYHLADSLSYQRFCRIGIGEVPKKSTLKRNLKRLRPETLEAINRLLLEHAKQAGIEKGRTVRTDCTVEETLIHAPTDSSLLWDGVRVLTRLMVQASDKVTVGFSDHRRRAKRRAIGIQHAPTNAQRLPLYRDLLKVTDKTMSYAQAVAAALDEYQGSSILDGVQAGALATELRHYITLTRRVMDQTRRRVLEGQSVPAKDKIVSIFEPHSDVIIKDRRDTLYGHKLALTTGVSGLVLDCVIEDGNPADSTLAVEMVERQEQIYGRPPRQVCFDGGFASKNNVEDIKGLGVQDVCFTKGRFLNVLDMVKSSWVYRKLRRFRAGIEAGLSFLKRCFGLDRCTWKGLPSFKAYTWASIVSHNLLVVARHALA